jgi:hypothetical protein
LTSQFVSVQLQNGSFYLTIGPNRIQTTLETAQCRLYVPNGRIFSFHNLTFTSATVEPCCLTYIFYHFALNVRDSQLFITPVGSFYQPGLERLKLRLSILDLEHLVLEPRVGRIAFNFKIIEWIASLELDRMG